MDIQFYGANCLVLSTKQARLVVDDNLAELGAKSLAKEGDILLYTQPHGLSTINIKLFIDQPGEYEVGNVSIYGIAARAHTDEEGQRTATMFKIVTEEASLLIVGHIYPELDDSQLEAIGMIDAMAVPIGGHGYTLDSIGALKLIRKVEPKLVIPTHYDSPKLHYPVPQQQLTDALKDLAMEPKESVSKLRLKNGELSDSTQLVILEAS